MWGGKEITCAPTSHWKSVSSGQMARSSGCSHFRLLPGGGRGSSLKMCLKLLQTGLSFSFLKTTSGCTYLHFVPKYLHAVIGNFTSSSPLGTCALSIDTWGLELTSERLATPPLGHFPGFVPMFKPHLPQRAELRSLTSAIQHFFLYRIFYILMHLGDYLSFP